MADPPRDPNTGIGSTPPKAPRWVKLAGIFVAALALIFIILKLFGIGGEHGPGRHLGGGDTPSARLTQVHAPSGGDRGEHAPPENFHG